MLKENGIHLLRVFVVGVVDRVAPRSVDYCQVTLPPSRICCPPMRGLFQAVLHAEVRGPFSCLSSQPGSTTGSLGRRVHHRQVTPQDATDCGHHPQARTTQLSQILLPLMKGPLNLSCMPR